MPRLSAGNCDACRIQRMKLLTALPVEQGERRGLQLIVIHKAFSNSVMCRDAESRIHCCAAGALPDDSDAAV